MGRVKIRTYVRYPVALMVGEGIYLAGWVMLILVSIYAFGNVALILLSVVVMFGGIVLIVESDKVSKKYVDIPEWVINVIAGVSLAAFVIVIIISAIQGRLR